MDICREHRVEQQLADIQRLSEQRQQQRNALASQSGSGGCVHACVCACTLGGGSRDWVVMRADGGWVGGQGSCGTVWYCSVRQFIVLQEAGLH